MLTISGAKLVRLPTTRDIYMNQPCTCVGKVGETVKYGWARHPRRGQSVPRLECRIRMAARETAGSTMIVPPWPSLDRLKFCAEYWPSNVRFEEMGHAQREVARASATRSA